MLVVKDPAPGSAELGYVRRALEQGQLVVVPTDTVYGIGVRPDDEAAVARLNQLKGRSPDKPIAVAWPHVDTLLADLPDLSLRARWAIAALLPGPWTLVVDNPDGRWPWLTGGAAGPLGIRVPAGALELPAIAATSANPSGGDEAFDVAGLHPSIAEAAACIVDRGALPSGGASTVLDLTAWERGGGEVRVLRDPAGRFGQAFAALTID